MSKVKSIDHTMIPLDYTELNLEEWRAYIHAELQNSIMQHDNAVIEAKRILTQEARYKTPLTEDQKVKGDRIVYAILFICGIAAALLFTLKN